MSLHKKSKCENKWSMDKWKNRYIWCGISSPTQALEKELAARGARTPPRPSLTVDGFDGLPDDDLQVLFVKEVGFPRG